MAITPAKYLAAPFLLTEPEMKRQLGEHAWPHYVYGLCAPGGLIFYLGKGTGKRVLDHVRDAKAGEKSLKAEIIRECGKQLRYTIFAVCADDAYAAGIEAVQLLRNFDLLSNVARGSKEVAARMETAPDPYLEALASLDRAQQLVDEMDQTVATEAAEAVARYPWLRAELTEALNGGQKTH